MARAFSIEDGNLNTSLIATRNQKYVDVDLSFTARPSGDLYKKTDAESVKQGVKNLLLTAVGEKPFQPDFGTALGQALFELDTDFDPDFLQNLMADAINNYEPRALVLSITVDPKPEQNAVEATIEFQVQSTKEVVSIDVTLARLR